MEDFEIIDKRMNETVRSGVIMGAAWCRHRMCVYPPCNNPENTYVHAKFHLDQETHTFKIRNTDVNSNSHHSSVSKNL